METPWFFFILDSTIALSLPLVGWWFSGVVLELLAKQKGGD